MKIILMRKILISIFACGLLLMNTQCGSGGGTSDSGRTTNITINLGGAVTAASTVAAARETSSIPPDVALIRVTISAEDMETIVNEYDVSGVSSITISIDVLNGPDRLITVEGIDAQNNVLYRASQLVNLEGTPLSLTLVLEKLTVQQPPVFSGIASVIANSATVTLFWSPATDDVSSQSAIVYDIYISTTSGGQSFSAPDFTTSAGATSQTITTGLTPGTTYYFVVRAKDEAGNRDSNAVERSGIRCWYVDAVNGSDTSPDCGSGQPCKTITNTLSQRATVDDAICAEAGTYNANNGESFPLPLSPGMSLVCLGPNHTSIIDGTGGPFGNIIEGASGATIKGCAVIVEDTGINDLGQAITVDDCVINAISGCVSTGITLSADSTVTNSTIRNIQCEGSPGILIAGGSPTISGNTITNNDDGIFVSIGSPNILNNTITTNGNGINISGGTPVINNNILSCNNFVDLNNNLFDTVTIDATNNRWDHTDPSVGCATGDDICNSGTAVIDFTGNSLAPSPCGP